MDCLYNAIDQLRALGDVEVVSISPYFGNPVDYPYFEDDEDEDEDEYDWDVGDEDDDEYWDEEEDGVHAP